MIIALAAQVAGDDGSAHASEIVNVTKGGEKCSTYADCLALIEAGTDIDYEGVSGPTDMSGNGEPIIGSYAVQVYGDDNRLDPELETFKLVEASDEFKDMPNDPVDRPSGPATACSRSAPCCPRPATSPSSDHRRSPVCRWPSPRSTRPAASTAQDVVLVEGDSGDTTTDTAVQTVTRELPENVDAIIGAASSSVSASVIDQITAAGVTQF